MSKSALQAAFATHARPEALVKELAKSPELAIQAIALLGRLGEDGAIERAGFDAKALGSLAAHALHAGMHSEADALAEACYGESARVAQALCQAFEESLKTGSYHRWSVDCYDGFFGFHHHNPQAADVWIRSEALKIEPDDFWDHVERHPQRWEDPASCAALALRAENYALGSRHNDASPSWRAMENMGPQAFDALCQGLGRAGAWEALCSCIQCCEKRPDLAGSLLNGCLAALEAKPHGHGAFEAICELAPISAPAAAELAKAAASLDVELCELGGSLTEPSFPAGHPECGAILSAFSWSTPRKDGRPSREPPTDLPQASLTVAELIAQWGAAESEVGGQVAELTQFSNTPKAQAVRALLEKLPSLKAGSSERQAALDAIALRQASSEPAAIDPQKTPRL